VGRIIVRAAPPLLATRPRDAGRAARAAALAAHARMRVGAVRVWQGSVLERGCGWASACAAVGARRRLSAGCAHV
jgi:hypothetical protein